MNPESLPLRDIHLPPPVGWWPPAPGWWLLAALLVAAGLAIWWWRRRPRPAIPVAVLAEHELASIRTAYAEHADPRRLAEALSVLLRRIAVADAAGPAVAGATGEPWLAYLDARVGAPLFSEGPGRALLDAPYRPEADFDAPGLLDACGRLLRAMSAETRA